MGVLRTYLAIAVVISHSQHIWGFFGLPPNVAVRVFFIISGFYMALISGQKYKGPNALCAFIVGRALRIYPLFWVATLFAILVNIALQWKGVNEPVWQDPQVCSLSLAEKFVVFLPNFTALGADLPFLFVHDPLSGWEFTFGLPSTAHPQAQRLSICILNSPAWTLGNELAFYLLVPFVTKLSHARLGLLTGGALAVLLFLETQVAPWSSYFFFPSNLAFFTTGIFAHRFYSSSLFGRIGRQVPKKITSIAVVSTLGLLFLRQYIPLYRNYDWTVYALSAVLIPWLFEYTKRLRFDRYIGELSYPIYILHTPLILILNKMWGLESGALMLLLTIAVSLIAVFTIESPLEVYRQRVIEAMLSGNTSDQLSRPKVSV